MHLNIHIQHLTDKGSPHSWKVAIELTVQGQISQIKNTHWKAALSPLGPGSRISQALNTKGWAFQECLIDWSVLRESLIITMQEKQRLVLVLFEEGHLPDHSALQDSRLKSSVSIRNNSHGSCPTPTGHTQSSIVARTASRSLEAWQLPPQVGGGLHKNWFVPWAEMWPCFWAQLMESAKGKSVSVQNRKKIRWTA